MTPADVLVQVIADYQQTIANLRRELAAAQAEIERLTEGPLGGEPASPAAEGPNVRDRDPVS